MPNIVLLFILIGFLLPSRAYAALPTATWTQPPPANVTAGQGFQVAWTTTGSPTHVNVHWNPTDPLAPGCCLGPGDTTDSSTVSPTPSPTTLTAPTKHPGGTPITSPTTVRYVVHVSNSAGSGSSAIVSVTLNPAPTPPGPFTLTATPQCSGTEPQIALSWTPSAGATSYDVYRNGTLYFSGLTGTTFLNTLVTAGTTYTYFIRARNSAGTRDSNTVTATAPSCGSVFDYSLSNSGDISVIRGASGSTTITATLVSGTPQPVSFAASGLPTGATAAFSPASCTPTCSSTLSITTSGSTPTGTFPITVTGTPLGRTTTFNLIVNPAPTTFQWPVSVNNRNLSQDYAHYDFGSPGRYHGALDIPATLGTSVLAAATGRVVKIQQNDVGCDRDVPGACEDHGFGNTVIVEHNSVHGVVYSQYSHLDLIQEALKLACGPVDPGRRNRRTCANPVTVNAGDALGAVGCTRFGLASCDAIFWAHLHFEIKNFSTLATRGDDLGEPDGGGFGYTSNHPDLYGYRDPVLFFHQVTNVSPMLVRVTQTGVNVRMGPEATISGYPVLTQVEAGEEFTAIRKTPEATTDCSTAWYQIQLTDGRRFAMRILGAIQTMKSETYGSVAIFLSFY